MNTSDQKIIAALDRLRIALLEAFGEIRSDIVQLDEKIDDTAPGSARAGCDRSER